MSGNLPGVDMTEILNNPEIENAIVPEMNNEQGPFMHMALLKNPEAYTNRATARFYGKESQEIRFYLNGGKLERISCYANGKRCHGLLPCGTSTFEMGTDGKTMVSRAVCEF